MTAASAVPASLVTGASRGIGHGIAMWLAARGHRLTVSARDADALAVAAERLRAAGSPDVRPVVADLADDAAVVALAEAHLVGFDRVDTLVLGAGVGTAATVAETQPHRWDKQFAVNVRSAYRLTAALLPALRATAAATGTGARVIALSSIGGVYAEPGLGAYGASKAALVSLCRSVNVEESGHGVAATAVCPGYVDTYLSAWVRDQVPAASMIRVDDVVHLVGALLSLSTNAVVSELVVSRAGTDGHRA